MLSGGTMGLVKTHKQSEIFPFLIFVENKKHGITQEMYINSCFNYVEP